MKSSRYTPEQVAFGLRQAEAGTPVSEACRKIGISEQTFCRRTIGAGRKSFRAWAWPR